MKKIFIAFSIMMILSSLSSKAEQNYDFEEKGIAYKIISSVTIEPGTFKKIKNVAVTYKEKDGKIEHYKKMPETSLKAYQEAPGWKNFKHIEVIK